MFCFFLIQFPSSRIEVARRSFILQPWLQSHYSFLFSLCGRAGNQLTKGCWIGNWQLSNWGEGKPAWRGHAKNSIANSDIIKCQNKSRVERKWSCPEDIIINPEFLSFYTFMVYHKSRANEFKPRLLSFHDKDHVNFTRKSFFELYTESS